MSSPLDLARALSELDAAGLADLLVARDVDGRSLRDLFDVADTLLDEVSVLAALAPFDRGALVVLAGSEQLDTDDADPSGRKTAASARRLALLDAEGVPYPVVATVARRVVGAHASMVHDATGGDDAAGAEGRPALAPTTEAAERVTSTTYAVYELLDLLRDAPPRWRAQGGIAQADERRLAAELEPQHADVAHLTTLAIEAGLAAVDGGALLATAEAMDWALLPPPDRWLALVHGWVSSLPGPLRDVVRTRPETLSSDTALARAVESAYPAASRDVLDQVPSAVAMAEALGLTASGAPSAFAALTHPDADRHPLTDAFPASVDRVYLLDDLSIVSPGPLVADVDLRLRSFAAVESRGLATTYRISRASVDRALSAGETESRMRALLERISLTGVPQALDYLLREAAAAHGRLRVRAVDLDQTLVETDDRRLSESIAVDQSLSALRVARTDETTLRAGRSLATVYWMLVDAGYSPSAWDADREIPMTRIRLAAPADEAHAADAPAAAAPPAAAVELASRLLEATPPLGDGSSAWTARELERALRARERIRLGVRMPDGSRREIVALPLGLSGGRLRFSDTGAAVERTVPLSAIDDVALDPPA